MLYTVIMILFVISQPTAMIIHNNTRQYSIRHSLLFFRALLVCMMFMLLILKLMPMMINIFIVITITILQPQTNTTKPPKRFCSSLTFGSCHRYQWRGDDQMWLAETSPVIFFSSLSLKDRILFFQGCVEGRGGWRGCMEGGGCRVLEADGRVEGVEVGRGRVESKREGLKEIQVYHRQDLEISFPFVFPKSFTFVLFSKP